MSEPTLFFADGNDAAMLNAFNQAQKKFNYFWRELSWEYQRIIPALDLACVKVAFVQETNDKNNPIVEHMWINEVEFDGETIHGVLVNQPNEITNVSVGDQVSIQLNQLSDWMFATQGKTYGGFTIQAMRANMSDEEREEHDAAWGLDFGDFKNICLAYNADTNPENLIEHPMSVNTRESFIDFLEKHPAEIHNTDNEGYTLLHRHAIAGNKTMVDLLVLKGADKTAKTLRGKTAFDFAQTLHWEHLLGVLQQ